MSDHRANVVDVGAKHTHHVFTGVIMGVSAHRLAPRRGKSRKHLGTCPASGKTRFRDHSEAVGALHTAAVAREFSGGTTRRQECRCYSCPACHGWHLTSQAA
jgi:hypothetical protein